MEFVNEDDDFHLIGVQSCIYRSIFIFSDSCVSFASSVPNNYVADPIVIGHVDRVMT
jgi:hypothetical protein